MLNVQTNITTDFLTQTEVILSDIVENKDFERGFEFINGLLEKGKEFARGISILLDGMESVWVDGEHEGESFLHAANRITGLSPETIRRHTRIQKLLDSDAIPLEFRPQIEGAGEKSLVQIANVVEAGYELEHKDWLRLSEKASDEQAVGKITREIKGVPPRSNFLAVTIDERGVLVAHTKDIHQEFGRLDIYSENPAVQKAIARIVGCANVFQSVEY